MRQQVNSGVLVKGLQSEQRTKDRTGSLYRMAFPIHDSFYVHSVWNVDFRFFRAALIGGRRGHDGSLPITLSYDA